MNKLSEKIVFVVVVAVVVGCLILFHMKYIEDKTVLIDEDCKTYPNHSYTKSNILCSDMNVTQSFVNQCNDIYGGGNWKLESIEQYSSDYPIIYIKTDNKSTIYTCKPS